MDMDCVMQLRCRWMRAISALLTLTVRDAVKVRMDEGALLECEVNAEVLTSVTMDQFRTFQMCGSLLHFPTKLVKQCVFCRHYEFDSVFAREVLGKNFSKSTWTTSKCKSHWIRSIPTRSTSVSLSLQFDNFNRVFKVVEELKGTLVENIQHHFLQSNEATLIDNTFHMLLCKWNRQQVEIIGN
uniref:Fibroblast growth factor (acidic) intracellular binding protein b n=1 Tax=Salmo trutta TaxID=8032 RepID=A0A673YXV0_SALTR